LKKNQQGTAIIVALFVTALVAAAAIAMIEHLSIDTRRTELILNNIQANGYATGSIAWAKNQLINDWKFKQTGRVIDRTPISSPANQINNATIESIIYDAQGKLNLNNLGDSQYQAAFTRLIQLVAPNVNATQAQNITLAIASWITPGNNANKYDAYYAKQNPPYRSPHQMMMSVSELRLIQGVTPELYTKLMPYVTALPDKTKMNINSAPIPVIMSLSPAIKLDTAKSFDAFRHQSPLSTLEMLANFTDIKNSPIGQSGFTVSSDYFLVKTNVTIDKQHITLYTLLNRILKNGQPTTLTVWQSKGTL